MLDRTILIKRFGRQVRIFRKQKMLSREELGSRIRLSAEEIKELENGYLDPRLSTVFLIAQALDVHPEDLLVPSGGSESQYYAYRCYLLKMISTLSKKDVKKAIELLRSLLESR